MIEEPRRGTTPKGARRGPPTVGPAFTRLVQDYLDRGGDSALIERVMYEIKRKRRNDRRTAT